MKPEKIQGWLAAESTEASTKNRAYRVLMIAPTSFFADYGCHVRILEEARILQKLGHQVTIVTYHNGNKVAGIDIRRTLPIPWRRDYEVGSSRHKIAFDALLGLRTLSLLLHKRFDVIHAHLHEGALLGIVLGRLFQLPVLFDFQGSLTEEMADHGFLKRDSRLFSVVRQFETWIDRTMPSIITSSSHAQRMLIEQFRCGTEQVQTLPDCVNGDNFRPASEQPQDELISLRERLQIPTGRKLIVYLGLLAEHQGINHLLQSLAQVFAQRTDVHLLLMGFPNVDFYQSLARSLGVAEHVTFTGRVPYQNAPQYLALGDLAVAPKLSTSEGSGKLLNYMAVGLPTIAFDIPVAREYLGLEGIYAQRGDVEDLASKILSTLDMVDENPVGAAYIGERLRQRAIKQFGWDTAGRQIEAIYHSIVERRAMPSPRHQRWAVNRESKAMTEG